MQAEIHVHVIVGGMVRSTLAHKCACVCLYVRVCVKCVFVHMHACVRTCVRASHWCAGVCLYLFHVRWRWEYLLTRNMQAAV